MDLISLFLILGFFAASWGLVRVCEALQGRENRS
jgi:hypothetical protein